MCSAPLFQVVMTPSRSLLMMASSEDSTIAASSESRSGFSICMQGGPIDDANYCLDPSDTLHVTRSVQPAAICQGGGDPLPSEVGSIPLGVLRPLFGQVVQREDGGNRANRHAGAAVDAFHRVDIDHLFASEFIGVFFRVNAVHRAGVHARHVLHTDAGFRNDIRHRYSRLSAWGRSDGLNLQ